MSLSAGKARVWRAYVTGLTLVALTAAACGSSGSHGAVPTTAGTSTTTPTPVASEAGLHWYIGEPVLHVILAADPTISAQTFDNPRTFIAITEPSEMAQVPAGWSSEVVETFFSGTDLVEAISGGKIPAGVKGVVLDDESGNHGLTPAAEQADPVPLEQQAAAAAKSKGLQFLDVGQASASGPDGRFHAAQYASVVDLQVQLSETQLPKFDQTVSKGVQAFHQVNKGALVLVGITAELTNGQAASPTQMLQAVTSTRSEAGGYWLNCTPCGAPAVSAAVQFLHLLAKS